MRFLLKSNLDSLSVLSASLFATSVFLMMAFFFVTTLETAFSEMRDLTKAETATVSNVRRAENDLAEKRILTDLKLLAGDEWEGRGSGTKGQSLAADYIKKTFAEAGLKIPAGQDDAFLDFQVPSQVKMGKQNLLTLSFPEQQQENIPLKLQKQFTPCSFGAAGKFSGQIVFCGYGISLRDKSYDDFANVDLKGKVALILRRVPNQADKKGSPFYRGGRVISDASLLRKATLARNKGAVAILFVTDPYTKRVSVTRIQKQIERLEKKIKEQPKTAEKQKRFLLPLQKMLKKTAGDQLIAFGYGGAARGKTLPTIHVTNQTCNQILKAANAPSLEKLEADIDSDGKPRSFALKNVRIAGEITFLKKEVHAKNVIGVFPGEGPLAEETIVLGGHYDHLGRGGRGSLARGSKDIHNGADDNASGTSLVLELAKRFGKREQPLKRKIVFVTFAGEEMGLLGSRNYVANPPIPLEKTIAMLNFDMVGRSSDSVMTVFGTKTSSAWNPLLDKIEKNQQMMFNRKSPGMGPSDHQSFYAKKIPVLHFFTGLHGDYHRPSDDWQKVNIQGIRRTADFIEKMVIEIALQEEKPDYKLTRGRANPLLAQGTVPYFGSIPDTEYQGTGYRLKKVILGSPASAAKLKTGDIITKFEDATVQSIDDFNAALKSRKAKETLTLTFTRNEKDITAEITLAKPR